MGIVEPEIVPNGDHGIYACAAATEKVLAAQFKALLDHHVYLEGAVLKPNMVKNGLKGPKATPEEIATINLSTMHKLYPQLPWHVSFSYGKALQKTAIVTWLGKSKNKEAAQKALKARAFANRDAVFGK